MFFKLAPIQADHFPPASITCLDTWGMMENNQLFFVFPTSLAYNRIWMFLFLMVHPTLLLFHSPSLDIYTQTCITHPALKKLVNFLKFS